MIFKPRDYQIRAIEFILNQPRAALWMQMGLGKTVCALTAVDILRSFDQVSKVLVIAPKRVANLTWPDEIVKWDHLHDLAVAKILGSAAQRGHALCDPAPVHVINYENIPWLLDVLGDTWLYDMVIADESTKLKSHSSVRFRGKPEHVNERGDTVPARRGLKHIAGRTKRWLNLTGTPMPKGLHDLWSQTYLLDGGKRLGKNITAFRNRWFSQNRFGESREWEPREWAFEEITDKVKDLVLTLRSADYLDLPDIVRTRVEITLPDEVMADYRALEQEFYLKVEQHEIVAGNAGVATGKLRQYAAGAMYTDDQGNWVSVHNAKIEALESIVDEAGGLPLLVFYNFKSDLARIKAAFPQAKEFEDDARLLRDWNAGRIPILLLHPQSAGYGLNLQDGSNLCVFFSLDWSLDAHDQAIERIGPTRQMQSGHPRPVFVYYITARDTVDELILERLIERREIQDILLKATKQEAICSI